MHENCDEKSRLTFEKMPVTVAAWLWYDQPQ